MGIGLSGAVGWQWIGLDGDPSDVHPKVRRLVRRWQASTPGAGALPSFARFALDEDGDLAPHLWRVEVAPEDPRVYRIAEIGEALIAAGAVLRAGDFFADATPHAAGISSIFGRIWETRQGQWRRGPAFMPHSDRADAVERVFLPMAEDGVTVDVFLCMSLFLWRGSELA